MPILKLEPGVAARLVDRLATDDAYRELFCKDTATALREIGHIADIAELNAFLADCYANVALADKATIWGAKDEILKMLTRGGNQTVPMLDANLAAGRKLLETRSDQAA